MTVSPVSEFTRITTAATWTEVVGAAKGLSDFNDAADVAELDVLIVNWDADEATILVAVTATSTAPAADTEAILREVKAQNAKAQLQITLSGAQHVWVKCDQTDTRVLVSGFKEVI